MPSCFDSAAGGGIFGAADLFPRGGDGRKAVDLRAVVTAADMADFGAGPFVMNRRAIPQGRRRTRQRSAALECAADYIPIFQTAASHADGTAIRIILLLAEHGLLRLAADAGEQARTYAGQASAAGECFRRHTLRRRAADSRKQIRRQRVFAAGMRRQTGAIIEGFRKYACLRRPYT